MGAAKFRVLALPAKAVPIRFESCWQKYWHDNLTEGTHYVAATRKNIGAVIAELRDSPNRAHDIAGQASDLVRRALSVDKVEESLQRIWLKRIRGVVAADMH